MSSSSSPTATTTQRQIRASYDVHTITVYQAFSSIIALPAVASQNLAACPSFKHGRMTWIKPSWCWMMYRSGYSFKDAGQERILALTITHADFVGIPQQAQLSHASKTQHDPTVKDENSSVVVQWDPERGPRLERLNYRSMQIGIPGKMSKKWTSELVQGIEDVTEKARQLKKVLDESPGITDEDLKQMGLLPNEDIFELPEVAMERLQMDS
ncbi:ATP-dependent RNA helicase DHX8 [Viridothelium virens]|uniref:ATP-dependent RNA helicase DHX8 n=1 Tax=Viridothelium virens TaxID=1048519 RepID=A0A6A6GZU2_VIRVR|nr:ATP-dependent RNA helicase DHX8 [Viridothelium virens]